MKATGIVRRVDDLGRIVIPKEIRKAFAIDAKEGVEIYVSGQSIILRKYQHTCALCDSEDNLSTFGSKLLCQDCINQIGKIG